MSLGWSRGSPPPSTRVHLPICRPGTCTIGSATRRQCRRVAAVDSPGGPFVPFALDVERCPRARQSFPVTLALRRGTASGRGPVDSDVARRTDRQYAARLTLLGVLGGAALTAAVYGGVMTPPV